MLQWMGGARRKMKATKDSKLKRQLEFFDHRKERRIKKDLGEEPGKLHTLADYIRQNLHGGESLDILGLRSLNPTLVNVDTVANSDANLPDPATAALRPEPGDAGGVTLTISNISASSVGALKGDDQDTSPEQPECKTKNSRIIQEQGQEKDACVRRKSRVADATQQEIKKLVNRTTELPLPGKGRHPVHVGNLQTKKVASTPRLLLSDMILSDNKGDSCDKKRLISEVYAISSQDGVDAIDESLFDRVAQHPQQQTFVTSDSIADWDDTKQLLASSLQLKSSYDCYAEPPVNGTSELLSRFLSTQKLKQFKGISPLQHGRQPQEYNIIGEDSSFKREFLLNNEDQNLNFSNPIFDTTNEQVKKPREINISKAMFDVENFHVNQELEKFDMSDPFASITSYHIKHEHQDSEFSDPFAITKKRQVKQERQECEYLNLGFNTGDHEVAQECSFLLDLCYDQDAFKVDSNFLNENKRSSSPENDLVTWDFDPQRHTSCLKREFPGLEKLRLPLDNFEVEAQDIEAAFSSLHDYSPRRMKISRSNFENDAPDWDAVLHKKCTFSEPWNCEPSVLWSIPRRQENSDPLHSGGYLDQTRNHNDDYSWSQTKAEGTEKYFTDYLTGDINGMQSASPRRNVMQEKDLSSETQAAITSEILQDAKPLFLPQINSGNEDCIIVCFPDNEDSPNVDADTIHLPIQSINIPLQLFGTVESTPRIVHDINVLSPETPLNRISQEIDDSRVAGKVVRTAKAATISDNTLILGQDSACDTILTSNHQSRNDHLLVLNSVSSFKRDTEVLSWQVKDPEREAYSEAQPPNTRRSTSNLLAIEARNIENGLEHHSSNGDKADQCFSVNALCDHSDDRAAQHKMMHNVQENSLEGCTLLKVLQEDMNGMGTTKAEGMLKKRMRAENVHNYGCQASFSSQEECSPAFQLTTVQAVLCKLRRPVCSCGSKQGKLSEHDIKNVNSVLLKRERSTRPSDSGLGHQDAEGNQILQKDIKRTSDMNQKSELESEIGPTAALELRALTERPQRRLSDINKQSNKEARLSLEDIDAIASSSHRVSIQPYQRGNGLGAQSLMSAIQMKEVPKFPVLVGDTIQHPTPVSQKKQILVVLEEEHPYARISDPLAKDAKEDCAQVSQRNPILVMRDKEQSQLKDSDPLVPHAGVLEFPSNTPQVSERQKVVLEASQEQLDINGTQQKLPSTEKILQDGEGSSTINNNMTYDAAYVKMLESYVVQLKLENNALRLSTAS